MPSPCRSVVLRRFVDGRGVLDVTQLGDGLPFAARRFYLISGVPEGVVRGHHGHRSIEQLFIAVRGRVRVELQGAGKRRTIILEQGTTGLYLAASIYSTQQFFEDATLLVLASGEYDPAGYVSDAGAATGDVGDE